MSGEQELDAAEIDRVSCTAIHPHNLVVGQCSEQNVADVRDISDSQRPVEQNARRLRVGVGKLEYPVLCDRRGGPRGIRSDTAGLRISVRQEPRG